MKNLDQKLKTKYDNATSQVATSLKSVETITEDDARKIIQRYTAVFEGNFLSWMSGASITARSVVSRFAADENLWVELKYDHPAMLRNFAVSCNAEPSKEDFKYMHEEIQNTRNMVSELSGLKNICLMGTLENTSAAFIPYMAELGKKLGCTDFTYTDVHGEADIEHANQFLEALSDEQNQGYGSAEQDIDNTIEQTLKLLNKIFV